MIERGTRTGAELAVALSRVAEGRDGIGGAELSAVDESPRGHLVDLAVAAERVIAWASGVQARAVSALHAQFMAEQDLDAIDLDRSAGHDGPEAVVGADARRGRR